MKAKFTNPLDNIKVASPCSQDWDAMIGTERKRYCRECKLNVYNLSGMTRAEAENLLLNSEGRLCVRFYRRADGSVLTEDCPVGWRAIKRRVSKMAAAFASLVFGLVGGLGFNSFLKNSNETTVGAMIPNTVNSNMKIDKPEILMGGMPTNQAMMGNFTVPNDDEVDEEPKPLMGKVAVKKNF